MLQVVLTPFSQSIRVLLAAMHAAATDLYVRPGMMAPLFRIDNIVATMSITLSSGPGFDNPVLLAVVLMLR